MRTLHEGNALRWCFTPLCGLTSLSPHHDEGLVGHPLPSEYLIIEVDEGSSLLGHPAKLAQLCNDERLLHNVTSIVFPSSATRGSLSTTEFDKLATIMTSLFNLRTRVSS